MNGVRANLTSASNAARDALCPGAHLAQRGLPEPPSVDAEAGHIAHDAFAGNSSSVAKLLPFQRKTVKRAKEIEVYAFNWWFESCKFGRLEPHNISARAHRERRLWAQHRGQNIHSGQIDAMWFTPDLNHALVEDLKSLFGDTEDPDANLQLRDYASLVWEHYGCASVTVFINQPNVKWKFEDIDLVRYEAKDLARAHAEMLARVLASNNVSSPRVPGPVQCRFCRAAGTARCPESQEFMIQGARSKFDWENAAPLERATWVGNLKLLEKLAGDGLERAKEALKQDPSAIAGWKLGKGRRLRSIEDVIGVGSIMRNAFGERFTADQLAKCFSVSVPKLEEFHAQLSQLDNPEPEFKRLFGHLIAEKEASGSLVKVK